MDEILISNLIVGVAAFFLFYFVYKKSCNGFIDYAKVIIPTMIIYYIFYFGAVMGRLVFWKTDKLWNPHNFGGMPSFAVSSPGVKWYNHIEIFISSVVTIATSNPLFGFLFVLSIFWLVYRRQKGKHSKWNIVLIMFAEIVMIFTTNWK